MDKLKNVAAKVSDKLSSNKDSRDEHHEGHHSATTTDHAHLRKNEHAAAVGTSSHGHNPNHGSDTTLGEKLLPGHSGRQNQGVLGTHSNEHHSGVSGHDAGQHVGVPAVGNEGTLGQQNAGQGSLNSGDNVMSHHQGVRHNHGEQSAFGSSVGSANRGNGSGTDSNTGSMTGHGHNNVSTGPHHNGAGFGNRASGLDGDLAGGRTGLGGNTFNTDSNRVAQHSGLGGASGLNVHDTGFNANSGGLGSHSGSGGRTGLGGHSPGFNDGQKLVGDSHIGGNSAYDDAPGSGNHHSSGLGDNQAYDQRGGPQAGIQEFPNPGTGGMNRHSQNF